MRLPPRGGRSCVVGAVVPRVTVTAVALVGWLLPPGLIWQEISAVAKAGLPEQL